MLKSLNVMLPKVAEMKGEKPISIVTVFPDSPVTVSDAVESENVEVSLVCVPSFN